MAKRRHDRWALGDSYSLPELTRGGPEVDLPVPDPVLTWVQFPDRILEVEARALAHTDRAVLVEWGFGQGADCAWVWRDAVRSLQRDARLSIVGIMNTISVAGASLLATLFPISLLILIVEARAAGPYRGTRTWRRYWETIHELGVAGALVGTIVCAFAVCSNVRIEGFFWFVVTGAAMYQMLAVGVVSVRLVRGIERGTDDEHPGHPRMRGRGAS